MLNIKVRISSVDNNGWVGRTHHPDSDMVGLIATVLRMSVVFEGQELSDPLVLARVSAGELAKMDGYELSYDCLTSDGRVATFMWHEVEPWSISDEPLPTGEIVYRHAAAYHRAVTASMRPTPRVVPIRADARIFLDELVGDANVEANLEACPGCGRRPGEGYSPDCSHPMGCGYWRVFGNSR